MKLQTQFTVPNKELKDLNYFKKVDLLDKFFDFVENIDKKFHIKR